MSSQTMTTIKCEEDIFCGINMGKDGPAELDEEHLRSAGNESTGIGLCSVKGGCLCSGMSNEQF